MKSFIAAVTVLISLVVQSGAVEDPVAFTAIKGGRNDDYISFQALVVNNKANFNTLFGVFKCESPGMYFFTYTAMSHEGNDLRLSLRTNKVPVVSTFTGSQNSFSSASGSAVLTLEENDIVYLFIERGDIYESNQINRAFTTFSGFQLSETKKGFLGLSSIIGRNGDVVLAANETVTVGSQSVVTADKNDRIYQLLKL